MDDALAWLASVQNGSGSWGTTFELEDTTAVVETLGSIGATGAMLAAGASWVADESASNHQFLALQVAALARVEGFETSAATLAASLLAVRNPAEFDTSLPNWPEGGWGIASGFETDCRSTALALSGLDGAGLAGGISVVDETLAAGATNVHEWTIPDDTVKARILITVAGSTVRLRMKEGSPPNNFDPFFSLPPGTFLIVFPDSGLPFVPGTNFIGIQSTGSAASYAFTASYETPDLDTRAFGEALDYLRESQNVDGGWGLQRGMDTEFLTTLHVLLALQAYPEYDLDVERAAGLAFLQSEQLPGGGFGFDGVNALSHVTAIGALHLIRSETFPFSSPTNDAVSALLGLQDPGGSWETIAFHTGLAIRALWEHNQPPTADAGLDLNVFDADDDGSEDVSLTGSGSDVDGIVESYSWSEEGVEIATGQTPTVGLSVGVHEVLLTVTDDGGRKGTDSTTVVVEGNCGPVTRMSCATNGPDVELAWVNGDTYELIEILRDSFSIALLDPASASYTDSELPTGTYVYTVRGLCDGGTAPDVNCEIFHALPCLEVSGLTCLSDGPDVDLAWTNGDSYVEIRVRRDGDLIATLPGSDTTHTDVDVPGGSHLYAVEGVCFGPVPAPEVTCDVTHANPCARVRYCKTKVSSAGCVPTIGSSGVPTLTGPDDFFITASQIIGQTSGFLLWSLTPNPSLTGPGGVYTVGASRVGVRLCVLGAPRIALAGSGGTIGECDGTFAFHFTQALMASEGLLAGTDVYAQFLYDDRAHGDGSGLGHTDGLRFTICP